MTSMTIRAVPRDRELASGHEAAHHVLAKHLGAHWSGALIWRGPARWDGQCRHARIDPLNRMLVAAAGAAGEGLLHGYRNPNDMVRFLGAMDAAASAGMEGGLRYATHVLGGLRREAWAADSARLCRDLRIGDLSRSARPPPPEWTPLVAADAVPQSVIIRSNTMNMQSTDPEYKTDQDCFTRLNAFLQQNLPDDCQSEAQELLEQMVAELTAGGQRGIASDAILLQVQQRTRANADAGFAKRFPTAVSLRRGF